MFYTADPEGGKHHLRLSEPAYLCLESDRQSFSPLEQPLPLAGFINRVFRLYRGQANASFALRAAEQLRQRQAQREALLRDPAFAAHRALLEQYDIAVVETEMRQQGQALTKQFSHSGGQSMKVRLNRENMDYLYGDNPPCAEDAYYGGRAGLYLRAVLEEYCTLDYTQRERIYFPVPSVQPGKTLLSLRTAAGEHATLFPLAVLCQALTPYNYLLGAALRADPGGAARWEPFSIRLNRITSCEETPAPKEVAPPDRETQSGCFAAARANGLSFVASQCETIRVRLSKPEGTALYRRILWYRPPIKAVEEETPDAVVYRFFCPPEQARNYFIRFGASARVLSPVPLCESIHRYYSEAAARYSSSDH